MATGVLAFRFVCLFVCLFFLQRSCTLYVPTSSKYFTGRYFMYGTLIPDASQKETVKLTQSSWVLINSAETLLTKVR